MRSAFILLATTTLALSGCMAEEHDSYGELGAPLTDEELTAKTLEMLNHVTTDLKVLDIDAKQTSTAAKALIAHRDGPDGLFPSEDDDLFDSIQEVDDVKGVGPSSIAKLKAFAETWVPKDPDAEPPPIEGIEAKVVQMLNHETTTLTILDIDASLTATAAKKLIEARDGPDGQFGTGDDVPFTDLQSVDDVKYVGASAISKLKAYAEIWTPELNADTGPKDVPKVLQFLNDPATTTVFLNQKVKLTTTQSNNIIAHRDGEDATTGTDDDDLYDTIDELDGVKYIGPKTIAKIEAYSVDWEPVDPAKVLLEQVLTFMNHPTTTLEALDVTVGLTSTASKNLIAARNGPDGLYGTEDDTPFTSIEEIDDVKYVGNSALTKIKTYAQSFDPEKATEVAEEAAKDKPLSCKLCGVFTGSPLEYDAGPPKDSGWAELFAAVPNFRAVAKALGDEWLVVNPETGTSKYDDANAAILAEDPEGTIIAKFTLTKNKFRYHMGPLFYRGRLDGTARVMVVGQEGATDEALVHRAFTGGTGQKVQNFLNALGITRSYILVNTFVYSIYEQYDEFTAELAMNGAIKEHRNDIMQKVMDTNDIQLICSFGNAAYNSVKIFREERFGGKFPEGTRWTHMVHPGAAALSYAPDSSGTVIDSGTINAVVSSMTKSWKAVWYWRYIDPGWLPTDPDGWTFQSSKFFFGDRDIPYRDLPYGFSHQIGRGGTKSERAMSGLQVQLRSMNGVRYEAPSAAFPATASKADSGFEKATDETGATIETELSWEPPRYDADNRHDPGPTADWVELFAGTPPQATAETEAQVDANNDFHQVPLWYRGNINGAPWLLIIAQDYGSDQVVAGRVLIGDAGQKINHFLENIGADNNYLMVSPYPYPLNDTIAQYDVLNLAQSPTLSAYREQILAKILADKPITTIMTFGEVAQAAFGQIAGQFDGTWYHMAHPDDAAAPVDWNAAMNVLSADAASLGLSGGTFDPYSLASFVDTRVQLPREDIPYGMPLWFGTSGDLSQQPDKSWIFWNAPKWVKKEPIDG